MYGNPPRAAPSTWNVNTGYFLGGVSVEQVAGIVRDKAPSFVKAMDPVSMDSYSEGFRAAVEAHAGGTVNEAYGCPDWPPKEPMLHSTAIRECLHNQAFNGK